MVIATALDGEEDEDEDEDGVTTTVTEASVRPFAAVSLTGSPGFAFLAPADAGTLPELLLSWVAVTTTGVLLFTLGAVKNPLLEIDPAVVDQVTAVFGVPVTRAVNCNRPWEASVALLGVSESATGEFEEPALALPVFCEPKEPQPVVAIMRQSKNATATGFRLSLLSPRESFATSSCLASHIGGYLVTEMEGRRASPYPESREEKLRATDNPRTRPLSHHKYMTNVRWPSGFESRASEIPNAESSENS